MNIIVGILIVLMVGYLYSCAIESYLSKPKPVKEKLPSSSVPKISTGKPTQRW